MESSSDEIWDDEMQSSVQAVVARRRFAMTVDALSSRIVGPKLKPTRKDWERHVCREGPLNFRKMYRLDVWSFKQLLKIIEPKLETKDKLKAENSAGSEVCAELRLAVALRYLAGGSVWDIQSSYEISVAEFYRSVWRVVDEINSAFTVELNINDFEKRKEYEQGFALKSRHNIMRGAIGALDGFLIWKKNPGVSVHNPNRHYCARKEKFSLLLMAICDSERRFTWFDISCTPTTHDSLAWQSTALGHRICNGALSDPFFLLADSAFTTTRSVISPGDDDDFNFEQSSLRINIECAFGELIRRWGILWRPLEMKFDKRSAVVGACIRLHNYCVNRRLHLTDDLKKNNGWIEVVPGLTIVAPLMNSNGIPIQHLTSECRCQNCNQTGRASLKAYLSRRAELEKVVRDEGLRRPYRGTN